MHSTAWKCSNKTLEELKDEDKAGYHENNYRSNKTLEELKGFLGVGFNADLSSSNKTLEELKVRRRCRDGSWSNKVPIRL